MGGEGWHSDDGPSRCQGISEPCIRLVCDSHTRVAYMCRLLIKFLLFEFFLKIHVPHWQVSQMYFVSPPAKWAAA